MSLILYKQTRVRVAKIQPEHKMFRLRDILSAESQAVMKAVRG
jgi:hypothetical protein